jgi:hypothetical protein
MRPKVSQRILIAVGLLLGVSAIHVSVRAQEPIVCSDFETGLQGWNAGGTNLSLSVRSDDFSDGSYLLAEDEPGGSGLFAPPDYHGDWTEVLSGGCGELCFRVNIVEDGVFGGRGASFPPRFTVVSDPDGPGGQPPLRASFVSALAISDPSGANPGWHTVCAPIGPVPDGSPPDTEAGAWQMLDGASPTLFQRLIAGVTELSFHTDLTGSTLDAIAFDDICLQPSDDCPICLEPKDERVFCTVDGSGDFVYRFRFENLHGHAAHHLFVVDLPAGVTATPSHFDLEKRFGAPVLDGGVSGELEVRFSGVGGLDEIPFRLSIHDDPLEECCAVEHTIELPDCDCAQVIEGAATCTLLAGFKGAEELISYSFQLQNLSKTDEVSYVFVTSDDGTVELVQQGALDPPLGYGDTVKLTLPITSGPESLPDGEICFRVSTHDAAFGECCAVEHCVPSPKSCVPTFYSRLAQGQFCPLPDPLLNLGDTYAWRLTDLGTSGDDGVELDFGSVEGFRVTWRGLEETASPPDGAFLRFGATGVVGGESGRELGEMRVTDVGESMEITADYSPVGSETKRLELYRGGALVEVIEGFRGDTVGFAPAWPEGCGKQVVVIDGLRTWCYWPQWPRPIELEIPGRPPVTVDGLRVIAESPSEALGAIESFRLQAAGIDPIDVVGVETVPGENGGAGGVSLATGFDESAGQALPGNAPDDDWRIVEENRPARVVRTPPAAWANDFGDASWISVRGGRARSVPGRRFTTYERCFCLADGADGVELALDLRADDRATVRLNGQPIAGPGGRFDASEPLHADTAGAAGDGLFVAGENCLRVEVDDSGGVATGLLARGAVRGAAEACVP